MKKLMILGATMVFLAGCTSEATRMADCEAKGVSRDACYVAEQNRQATINSAAEKQALENARSLYPQKAQAAKKESSFTKHYNGMAIKRDKGGKVTVDENPLSKTK